MEANSRYEGSLNRSLPEYQHVDVKGSHVLAAEWLNNGQEPPFPYGTRLSLDLTQPGLKVKRFGDGYFDITDPSWKTPSESRLDNVGVKNLAKLLGEHEFEKLAIGDIETFTPLLDPLMTCKGIAELDLRCLIVIKELGNGKSQIYAPRPEHLEGILKALVSNPNIGHVSLEARIFDDADLPLVCTFLATDPNAAKLSVVYYNRWEEGTLPDMVKHNQGLLESPNGRVSVHLNSGNADGARAAMTGLHTLDLTPSLLELSERGLATLVEVLLREPTRVHTVKLGKVPDLKPILAELPNLRLSELDIRMARVPYGNGLHCALRPEEVDTLVKVEETHPKWTQSLVINSRWLPLEEAAKLSELLKRTGTAIHDDYTPAIPYSPLPFPSESLSFK